MSSGHFCSLPEKNILSPEPYRSVKSAEFFWNSAVLVLVLTTLMNRKEKVVMTAMAVWVSSKPSLSHIRRPRLVTKLCSMHKYRMKCLSWLNPPGFPTCLGPTKSVGGKRVCFTGAGGTEGAGAEWWECSVRKAVSAFTGACVHPPHPHPSDKRKCAHCV